MSDTTREAFRELLAYVKASKHKQCSRRFDFVIENAEKALAALSAQAAPNFKAGNDPATGSDERPQGTATPSAAPQQTGETGPTSVADAMAVVTKAMRDDPEYAWSWHCNIAMAYVDAGGDHAVGNHGAARFLRMLASIEPAHELPALSRPTPDAGVAEGLAEALRKLEWSGDRYNFFGESESYCTSCGKSKCAGHSAECLLSAALATYNATKEHGR